MDDYTALAVDPALVIRGDRGKMQQVLINLVSNAIKITSAGGCIDVKCESSCENVSPRIADTGKDILHERLVEIFKPSVQVDPKFTRLQDGVELGLAVDRVALQSTTVRVASICVP